MFLRPEKTGGTIETITGCMFSGKTEELIRRIKIAQAYGKKTALFKPATDTRYHTQFVVSHKGTRLKCDLLNSAAEIFKLIKNIDLIGIDEAQFFDRTIIEICKNLSKQNYDLIISGLDRDFMGNPFGPMPDLIEISDRVNILNAICAKCGDKAYHTFKKTKSKTLIEIGESDIYEARCYKCYNAHT